MTARVTAADSIHERVPVPPIVLILGATAAGKSAFAVELAVRLPGGGECVSADSMQVYRGMDIGTAKASPEERRGVPHHLIDIVEPSDDSFSAGRWLQLCRATVAEIRARGCTPLIVGGTNLYVQMLLGGAADELPQPDERLRAKLTALPIEELRSQLQRVDAASAARIHINDRKRTIRALEVFEQTGQTLSGMQRQWEAPRSAMACGHGEVHILGLDCATATINRRINARVKSMIEQGLVAEVQRLHEHQKLGRNAREALGYKQILEHLEGRISLEDAVEQIKIRTRRYAKQQRTWLRRFRAWQPSTWLPADEHTPQELAAQALAALAIAEV